MYTYTAFEGFEKLVSGRLEHVVLTVKKRSKINQNVHILIFSDSTGKQMDFDLSGSDNAVLERLKIYTTKTQPTVTKAGRPKLGVVPREISLLPSHWEWLSNQSGGASATIRTLIDEKIKLQASDKGKVKNAQEKTYAFLSALAGDLPNFEDAVRYLYRKDRIKFLDSVSGWNKDVVSHALNLSTEVF